MTEIISVEKNCLKHTAIDSLELLLLLKTQFTAPVTDYIYLE